MSVTALTEKLDSNTMRTAEYRGATSFAVYSDVPSEFLALLSGCGVYDLGWRAKIVLTGKDRVRWLNGMVTNNVRDLPPGHGVYAFVLNAQGHILGDLYAYNSGESLLVDTDRAQLEKMLSFFRKYIIMDKVEAEDISDKLVSVGIAGPRSRELLKAAGVQFPQLE